jgi:DNA modification methylase
MEYLCKLTKQPNNGIVLDPFAGSGTTGVACINTGRKYILIERELEYINIINERIKQANMKYNIEFNEDVINKDNTNLEKTDKYNRDIETIINDEKLQYKLF